MDADIDPGAIEDIDGLGPVAWEVTSNRKRIGIARYSKQHLCFEGAPHMLCGVKWPNVMTTNFGQSHEGRCERCYTVAADPAKLEQARQRAREPKPETPTQRRRREQAAARRLVNLLARDYDR